VLYALVANLAIGLCFVPLLFLGWKKMRQVSAYRAIAVYWFLTGLINLFNLDLIGQFRESNLQEKLTFWYNLVDTPLVLFIFVCASTGKSRIRLLWVIFLFIALESGLIYLYGYTFNSSTTIIGAGLILVWVYCITGLVKYMKQMEHTRFENSMVIVYAALLFAYSSFLIIYIFIHIHDNDVNSSRDSFLLYYIGLLLSATITSLGLWSYGLRRRAAYSSSSSS
jgi:hypothetical protein